MAITASTSGGEAQPPVIGEQPHDELRGEDQADDHAVLRAPAPARAGPPGAANAAGAAAGGATGARARRRSWRRSARAAAALRRHATYGCRLLSLVPPPGAVLAHADSVRTQLASSRAPAAPDFSGWNWVARQRPVLDGGHERLAVLGPGQRRLGAVLTAGTAPGPRAA